jgi:hypothetical protein
MFSDACDLGYGAVGIFSNDENHRAFVAAKGFVINQRKPPTTPRGELQALLVATRLADSTLEQLQDHINIHRIIFWVDSSVVYYWTHNQTKRYKEFVANRLAEIHSFLDSKADLNPEVKWLDTKSNPADLISRGLDIEDLEAQFSFWTRGPEFIGLSEDNWPLPPALPVKKEDVELKKEEVFMFVGESEDSLKDVTDLKELACEQLQEGNNPLPQVMEEAENHLLKKIQEASFKQEIRQLKKRSCTMDTKGSIRSMVLKKGPLIGKQVFLDTKGRVRLVTRLASAEFMNWEERYPLILGSKHPGTRLLIRDYHSRMHHQGARTTYAEMMKRYHLPFSVVKSVVFRCQSCRESNPIKARAPMASIHPSRLQAWSAVFKETGMDYFGPFIIRGGKKIWGLLFTCLTTRAVHIEACPNLTVPTWLNAIERFTARRGQPESIRCDRAGTFVGGSKMLARIEEDQLSEEFCQELEKEVSNKFRIKFSFIPPKMPHFGGPWERMIGEAKRCMVKATASVAKLDFDALRTFLTRAEGVINRRPLAIGEDMEVITPASILAPATQLAHGFPPNCSLTRVMGQLRQAIDFFWRHWTSYYLQSQSADRFPGQSPNYVELHPGDRVLFKELEGRDRMPGASTLQAGIIKAVHPSPDGIVRRVTVETKDSKEKEIPLRRVYLPEVAQVDQRDT